MPTTLLSTGRRLTPTGALADMRADHDRLTLLGT